MFRAIKRKLQDHRAERIFWRLLKKLNETTNKFDSLRVYQDERIRVELHRIGREREMVVYIPDVQRPVFRSTLFHLHIPSVVLIADVKTSVFVRGEWEKHALKV